MDHRFLHLMPETITIYARTGSNMYGEPTFSTTSRTCRARIVRSRQTNRTGFNVTEQTNENKHTIWAMSTSDISVDSKIVLADGSIPILFTSDAFTDDRGIHHIKLSCGFGSNAR